MQNYTFNPFYRYYYLISFLFFLIVLITSYNDFSWLRLFHNLSQNLSKIIPIFLLFIYLLFNVIGRGILAYRNISIKAVEITESSIKFYLTNKNIQIFNINDTKISIRKRNFFQDGIILTSFDKKFEISDLSNDFKEICKHLKLEY